MHRGHRPLWLWALESLPADFAPETVSDVGCGGGDALALLAGRYPKARELVGYDLSPTSVEWTRRRNRGDARVRAEVADANRLPAADGALALATAFETVYFWQPIAGSFREIFRVLRPGGKFLVACELNDPKAAAPFTRRIDGMTAYTTGEIATALREAGFASIETAEKGLWMRILASKALADN